MENTIEAAREYKRRGWNPLPLKPGQKRPEGSEWQRTIIADDKIDDTFAGMNVGVVLGTQSGNIADVDLDEETVVRLAPIFLPKTDAVFGRPSKP